jgi:hypothetical protein
MQRLLDACESQMLKTVQRTGKMGWAILWLLGVPLPLLLLVYVLRGCQ